MMTAAEMGKKGGDKRGKLDKDKLSAIGRKGGRKAASNATKAQRSARARVAALKRWARARAAKEV